MEGEGETGGALARPVEEKAKPVRKVLVVDDDANIRAVLEYRLKSENYVVRLANDGLDALRQIGADDFDLIILDLLLPEMDGLAVLQKIKSDPRTSGVPVIVLSALSGKGYSDRASILGAERYIAKPVCLRCLVDDVRKLLGDGGPGAGTPPYGIPVWEVNYR